MRSAPKMRRSFSRETCGASAVEFALVAPVFLLVLAGAIDFGGRLYTKFSLDSAVSAAGNYGILNAASVSSIGGSTLAKTLATIVASGHAPNWANVVVVVDNGPTATLTAGTITLSGTASGADSCYCPTKSSSGVSFGVSMSCGAACPRGAIAGKFITVAATHSYVPIFPSFGLFQQNTVAASVVVQTQ